MELSYSLISSIDFSKKFNEANTLFQMTLRATLQPHHQHFYLLIPMTLIPKPYLTRGFTGSSTWNI